jgi:hypothetical protein
MKLEYRVKMIYNNCPLLVDSGEKCSALAKFHEESPISALTKVFLNGGHGDIMCRFLRIFVEVALKMARDNCVTRTLLVPYNAQD